MVSPSPPTKRDGLPSGAALEAPRITAPRRCLAPGFARGGGEKWEAHFNMSRPNHAWRPFAQARAYA